MITPLSPSPHIPGPQHSAAQWALTLCVLYQGPERGPLPAPGSPKDAFQDAHSETGRMAMSLPSGPGHWPCHGLSHAWGRLAVGRGERDWDVALASWCGKGCSGGSLRTPCAWPGAAAATGIRGTLSWGGFVAQEGKGSLREGLAAPSQGIQVPFFFFSSL